NGETTSGLYLRLASAEKRAQGDSGCNQFSGPYELRNDSLRLGQLTSTLRACADPAMNQRESLFLAALRETRIWRIQSDTLTLSGATGQLAPFIATTPR